MGKKFINRYESAYALMYDKMVIKSPFVSTVKATAERIKKNRARYEIVARTARVPWYFIGIIHYLESDLDFSKHLHNGDPLTAKTIHSPAGRPLIGTPPFTWEASALDALMYNDIAGAIIEWNVSNALYLFEVYNGFGYREHDINSPYLWSYTTYYSRGKFIADHSFSGKAISNQVGAAPLLKAILSNKIPQAADDNINTLSNTNLNKVEPFQSTHITYANILNSDETDINTFLSTHGVNMSAEDFLKYKDNAKIVFKSYNTAQVAQYKKASTSLIGIGARVKVPFSKMASKSIYSINQTLVENRDYKAFIEREIRVLLDNPRYKKLNVDETTITKTGAIYKKQDKYTIWAWCKSLSPDGGKLFDLSAFSSSVSITTTKEGSTFSIGLPHIMYTYIDGKYILQINSYVEENTGDNYISKTTTNHREWFDENVYKKHKYYDDNGEIANERIAGYLRRNPSFFHNLLQDNDVVFIKLEQLQIDEIVNDRAMREDDYTLTSDILGGKVFDLIGLVDTVPISTSAANNENSIVVSGRCLSKLIIDDGVFFFPVEYAVKDKEQIIKNSSATKSSNRLLLPDSGRNQSGFEKNIRYRPEGAMLADTQFNFDKTQTIEEWLTFIFSQLTNIDICPDALFKSVADKSFIISKEGEVNNNKTPEYKRVPANGIWQIAKLVVDKEIADRKVVDSSLSTDTGSLSNLINKVAQKPFIEFWMDTYGDKFYYIFRKPPFTFESFKSNFCINVFEHDVYNDTLGYATDEIYTWYKLNPMSNVFGMSDNSGFMSFFPAVMLPEYMEIWGNKALEIASNFIDFAPADDEESDKYFGAIKEQAYQDLDWLIETTCYLPFTRKGTITIKFDRRIKRGMNIRYFPTGELFYVEAVNNHRNSGESVDSTTTLTVCRGMIEEHLDKYFQIVNLQKNKQRNNETWTVNQPIFKFFLNRLQNV